MHPLAPLARYLVASIVGAWTVVEGIRIAKLELGNNVEGVIFRLGLRTDRRKGDDE